MATVGQWMIGRAIHRAVAVSSLAIAVAAGCSTVAMYGGPERPASHLAFVVPEGTHVESVDDRSAPDGARFAVLPGPHRIQLVLDDEAATSGQGRRYSTELMVVCFEAQLGHAYRLRPSYVPSSSSDRWHPIVVDAASNQLMPTKVARGRYADCDEQQGDQPATAAVATLPPPAATAPMNSDTDTSTPRARARVAAAARARAASAPRGHAITAAGTGGPPPLPAMTTTAPEPIRPIVDVHVSTGIALGGDRLVDVQFANGETRSLNAGDGVAFELGLGWTPLWLNDTVGIGVDLDFGFKYSSIDASNGSVAFTRLPVLALGHVALTAANGWTVPLRVGIAKDLAATLSGDGAAALPRLELSSDVGVAMEGGVSFTRSNHFQGALMLRVVYLTYHYGTAAIDGTSFGIVASIGYGQWKPLRRTR